MDRPKTLSAAFVRTVSRPGRYGDGRSGYGLSLLARETANGRLSKTWSQRVRFSGKATNTGLGGWPVVSLAGARRIALENQRSVSQGLDPRGGGIPDFETAVEKVIAIHADGWKDSGRTASKWRSQIEKHASGLARERVDQITPADVLAVLTPIWHSKPEIARRTRQRISAVMRWAIAQGCRADNPAGEGVAAALPKTGQPGLPPTGHSPWRSPRCPRRRRGFWRVGGHKARSRVSGADGLPLWRGPKRHLGGGRL